MPRIVRHPVLGDLQEGRKVLVTVDGEPLEAFEGEMIAAALMAAGKDVFRLTKRFHRSRQLFCGIGRCTDCVMVVDGVPNVRTCVTPVREGMVIETQEGTGRWGGE
jgi:predicted molibdopterin-dependent oxidoreductase YjgC